MDLSRRSYFSASLLGEGGQWTTWHGWGSPKVHMTKRYYMNVCFSSGELVNLRCKLDMFSVEITRSTRWDTDPLKWFTKRGVVKLFKNQFTWFMVAPLLRLCFLIRALTVIYTTTYTLQRTLVSTRTGLQTPRNAFRMTKSFWVTHACTSFFGAVNGLF